MSSPHPPGPSGRPALRLVGTATADSDQRPAVGLAYWLEPAQHATLTAAAQTRLGRGPAGPALQAARCELDAAAIRTRWFDPRAAISHRRIARMDPAAIPVRLDHAERDALLGIDGLPADIRAALGDLPPPPGPAAEHRPPPTPAPAPAVRPIVAGPLPVLATRGKDDLVWAVATFDGTQLTARFTADPAAWKQARHNLAGHHLDTENLLGARRFISSAGQPYATSLLLRDDLRADLAGETLVLHPPDVLVTAPEPLARRIALHAYPVPVRLLTVDQLPPPPDADDLARP